MALSAQHPGAGHCGGRAALRRWAAGGLANLLMLCGLAHAAGGPASASPPPLPADCALAWQVHLLPASTDGNPVGAPPDTPPDTPMLGMRLTLSFDAGGRTLTHLRLPGGWQGLQDEPDAGAPARLPAVADDPSLRRVSHAADQRVTLRWQHRLPASAGAGWLFSGQAVLPVPDELEVRPPAVACIAMSAPDAPPGETPRWISSHGVALGPHALWRLPASPDSLRSRVQQALYAGGAWQWQALTVEGQALTVARPDSPAGPTWTLPLPVLAQAGQQALAAQRRHWGETQPGPPLMLWAWPTDRSGGPAAGGSAWYRTAVVQVAAQAAPLGAPPESVVPASNSAVTPALTQTLTPALTQAVTQAFSRLWLLDRFGPLVQAGRDDEPLRRWFSEGVADFLAHQSLLRGPQASVADVAALAEHYNRQIERWNHALTPGIAATDPAALDAAAARGEWLALQWHALLRARGQPGLDALLRGLLVAPAQARRDGPISAPLATHRLVAALRARLGDLPLRELQRVVDRGEPAWVYPDTLADCFQVERPAGQGLRLQARPDALQLPACQGWLGAGPARVSSTPALAAAPGAQASLHSAGKIAKNAKASGRGTGKSVRKSTGKTSAHAKAESSTKSSSKARQR